jgi:carbon storage regulator
MLVLSRKLDESIVIDGRIVVKIVKIDRNQVRLAIDAPREVGVYRQELVTERQAEEAGAGAMVEFVPAPDLHAVAHAS